MLKKFFIAFIFTFLFFPFSLLGQSEVESKTALLSLEEIDRLIDRHAYNDSLKALTRYISLYPQDFDRAQKRISKVMKLRQLYNDQAQSLVEIIKNPDGSNEDKLSKITALEKYEEKPTKNFVDFTNLARRTVTMGEVLAQYNKIMREGAALVKKEKFLEGALKFEEGFSLKDENSDIIFDIENPSPDGLGTPVVYEKDITDSVKKSLANVRSIVGGEKSSQGMQAKLSLCEEAYNNYMQAISPKRLSSREIVKVASALEGVKKAFGEYSRLRNEIMENAISLDKVDALANERNPLLMGTSFITFHEKFIIGDASNPDTGIIGAMDAYFNSRVEKMKKVSLDVTLDYIDSVISSLPENKIFSIADTIQAQMQQVGQAQNYASFTNEIHGLYAGLKNLDGSSKLDEYKNFTHSLGLINQYMIDLGYVYKNTILLAKEEKKIQIIDNNDYSQLTLNKNLESIKFFEGIKADSKKFISMIENESQNEKVYFEEKERRENDIKKLELVTGQKIDSKARTTAGVQVLDEPVDFRKKLSYFNSINDKNYNLSFEKARGLWGYLASVYALLAENSYSSLEKKCGETEVLLNGIASEEEFELVKKYPIEAKERCEGIYREIGEKKTELISQRKVLEGGEEYRASQENYDSGTIRLDNVIANLDKLSIRTENVIAQAEPKIRDYESSLRSAYDQYEKALAAFKKENFDGANSAIDSASEKFAAALDIEYSDKIREMREVTLNELALKIQKAEYEKVLREVFVLKDQATTDYYSSNFDSAEKRLVSAQAKWEKVSLERDSEIENLLNIVRTVKQSTYGRVLEQSDPHYPELSASLDMAKQSFSHGVKLKSESRGDEAAKAFDVALSNVQNIKNIYPLNTEARLLELKIQREKDPEKFRQTFEQQYKAARDNARLTKSERLAEFEALYEINPQYPGLSQAIYDLKDSLGMIPKKTVKKEVKNNALVKLNEAQRVFKAAGNNVTALNNALKLVDQAIALDSTNKKAKELKLDIQLKIGAQRVVTSAILSQNEEKLYAEAARLFNSRDFRGALAIIQRMSAGAKQNRKVRDLKNRLDKRL